MPQILPRLGASLQRCTLRQRILLLFSGLAGAALLALLLSLYFGYVKHQNPWALDALIVGGILAGCAILTLIVGIWLLFDEHVAKPLERLAGELRARTHASVNADLTDMQARHLGDLAPAATALMRHLNEARNELAEAIARETTREVIEKERLIALVSDLPVGVLVCTPEHRLVLYNGRAMAMLGASDSTADAAPRLDRSIFDYLEEASVRQAYHGLRGHRDIDAELPLVCGLRNGGRCFRAGMRLLGERLALHDDRPRGYVLTLHSLEPAATAAADARPPTPGAPDLAPRTLVYDFGLLERHRHARIQHTPLDALTYVVFDTETTGLLPGSGDEIVQLAAVRIVNGRRVAAEKLDTLVNPGRAIPPSSTRIHGITDDMVADAPSVEQAVRRFHAFAHEAVLVAHNANFDMAFLRRHEARTGLHFDHPVLDTVLLSAAVFGDAENHSLDALTARLDVRLPGAARHTAIGDATATADALLKLLPALQAKGVTTFGDLEAESRRHNGLLKRAGA